MPSPIQLLRRARPYLTAGYNPNEEDDEPQDGQVDPYGGLLGRLSRALQPQEAVQPQMLQRMQPAAQPASMNSRLWDTSDTGGRSFMPDTGPTLRAPEGVATRPRVVPPEQVQPLAPLTRQRIAPLPSDIITAPVSSEQTSLAPMQSPLPTGTLNRPQQVEPDYGEQETNILNELASRKIVDHNGRLKSGAKRLLPGLIQGGLLGGAAEFLTGVVDPAWDERRARDKEFDIHAGNLKRYNEQADGQLKRKLLTSQIDENAAQAYERMHPLPEYGAPIESQDEQGQPGQFVLDRHNPLNRIQVGTPVPKPDTTHAPVTRPQTNPDGSTTLMQYDPDKKIWVEAPTEKGAFKSAAKPSGRGADGLTAYERLSLDLRRQGITYQKDKDQKQTQQSQQKYLDGTSRYYATRAAEAAQIAQKFDEHRAKALASDKKEDRDYWLAQAEAYRKQLAAFNDVYETGESKGTDGTMWGYAKPKVGKSVRSVMQGLGTNDPDEAVRYILDRGYVPMR